MTKPRSTAGKRLSESAWDALLEALAVFYWFKRDLDRFLRESLRDAPELLARINFIPDTSKRDVATEVVTLLRRQEDRYQPLVLDLLVRLAGFDRHFTRLASLDDGDAKVAAAQAAFDEVQAVVAVYSEQTATRERIREEAAEQREEAELRRTRDRLLNELKSRFLEMQEMTDAHKRGRLFEIFLNELFELVGLQPRAAYSIEHEQIDGAFTFQTDDYLLEARWWKTPLQPKHLNDFKAKIDSKAKNVLGLLAAVGGFTDGAIDMHSRGTPLILMDGSDLYAILEGRISLTEVLERKRRHAAETGSPMLYVRQMLA